MHYLCLYICPSSTSTTPPVLNHPNATTNQCVLQLLYLCESKQSRLVSLFVQYYTEILIYLSLLTEYSPWRTLSIYCGDTNAVVVWWEDHAYVFVRHPASLSPQHETAVITALVRASPQTCIMDISNTATSNDLYQVNSDTKCYRGLCIFLSLVFNSSRKLMRFCVWL